MKKIINALLLGTFIFVSGCRNTSNDKEVPVCLEVELATGTKKQITVHVPNYADLAVYESRGGYRLSTWEYFMWGLLKKERTLKNGVIDFKKISCK